MAEEILEDLLEETEIFIKKVFCISKASHLSALYDLKHHIITEIAKEKKNAEKTEAAIQNPEEA